MRFPGFLSRLVFFFLLFAGCTLGVSFGMPWVLDLLERTTGSPLPFEGALRLSILALHASLLLLALSWVIQRGTRLSWFIWIGFAISFLSLAVIFFGDRSHRLLEEYSWIRYTTASFLVLASVCCIALFARAQKQRADIVSKAFWFCIASGLLFAGLDEVFQIHEAIGRWLRAIFPLGETAGDLVTLGYALVTLVIVAAFLLTRFSEIISRYRIPAVILITGAGIYAFSTLLDTFDVFVHAKLRAVAHILTEAGIVMSDAWYLVWSIKNSLNGFEEVFEHTAALLFFLAFACILFESLLARPAPQMSERSKKIIVSAIRGGTVLAFVALAILSLPSTFPRSVLTNANAHATPLLSHADGLFHADDLDYHPSQGVILANEGRGNLYRVYKNTVGKISDPQKLIRDPDSVAANETGIYVSDGSAGKIILFTDGKQEVVLDRDDGLVRPEGIVAVGRELYILDESEQTISHYVPGRKLDIWKIAHPDWKKPEGITYDGKSKQLLVTDDTTGAIFRMRFKESIEKVASLPAPEDIAMHKDGSALITDTGWGAVFRLFPDGTLAKVVQFQRMYRDVQGVTASEKGELYVVTADGFDSVSFMPSFLFKIDGAL